MASPSGAGGAPLQLGGLPHELASRILLLLSPLEHIRVEGTYVERFNKSLAREAVAAYAAVAAKHGLSPATLALAFVRSRRFVTSTIIGATSVAQLNKTSTPLMSRCRPRRWRTSARCTSAFRDPATDA
jgi:aryl-alcohol dehydrogenase-like predicted oxidoreductase